MSENPAPVLRVAECMDCEQHAIREPHIVGACASVGIEHGKSTAEMMKIYLDGYHKRGHKPR